MEHTLQVQLHVMELLLQPETGAETIISILPRELIPTPENNPDTELTTAEDELVDFLSTLSTWAAHQAGQQVRGAKFWITSDPEVVREHAAPDCCLSCQSSTEQALDELYATPDLVFAVGRLSWC